MVNRQGKSREDHEQKYCGNYRCESSRSPFRQSGQGARSLSGDGEEYYVRDDRDDCQSIHCFGDSLSLHAVRDKPWYDESDDLEDSGWSDGCYLAVGKCECYEGLDSPGYYETHQHHEREFSSSKEDTVFCDFVESEHCDDCDGKCREY